MFWRKRNKKEQEVEPVTDLSSSIYTVSEEDLSPGFEEVYVPFLTISLDGEDVLVFARFIDGTTMISLEEACDEVVQYVERRYKQGRLAYRRLSYNSISSEEKEALDRIEQQLSQWIPKQD
ncbi:hypothetical protein J6TS1_24590 [Siminovitchia terrae]|uniref:Uncharacterized protein n=1 Tax=Siminovitchia terrae TaxID=1914933 RepID=A0ABQ4KX63_SIMTE|nr:hypothetical protein [Siminovitchia terrae]GIN92377.1 hypothetical protein J22TS1_34280 [Siminovitchia terrae]GIN96589.1 hypothetical protein J6TS1_24590 [Siminovitchia terrae]